MKIDVEIKRARKKINVIMINKIIKILLTLVFFKKVEENNNRFLLLFILSEDVDNLEN